MMLVIPVASNEGLVMMDEIWWEWRLSGLKSSDHHSFGQGSGQCLCDSIGRGGGRRTMKEVAVASEGHLSLDKPRD